MRARVLTLGLPHDWRLPVDQVQDGETALTLAAAKGHLADIMRLLTSNNKMTPEIMNKPNMGRTVFRLAIEMGDADGVRSMLEHTGIDVNAPAEVRNVMNV